MMFRHDLNCLDSILRNLIFRPPPKWPKLAVYSIVAVDFRISSMDHSKDRQKLWEYKLDLICFMILGQRYRDSKGVWEYEQEDPPLSQFGAPW